MPTDTIALSQVAAPPLNLELDLVDRPTRPLMSDLEAVSAAYSSFRAALPGFKILYAMKANPHPEIVNTLARCGAGFEVALGAELQILFDCDIEARDVMFSNPVKAPLDIREAYDYGVPCFSFDSDSEIVKLALEAPGSAVSIRLATTGSGSRFPMSKKCGVGPHEAVELLKLARNFGLVPYGCTFHVGSQNTGPRSWDKPIEDCAFVMSEFERLHGSRLQMLNIGGGFPAQYAEDQVSPLEEFGSSILASLERLPYPVELVAAPGRALVANAGAVASVVIAPHRQGNNRGRSACMLTDAARI